jgi:RNA polymerase sigma factor for flagellar operon FliA
MRWFQIADYHRGRYEHLAQDALETTQPESEPPPGSVDQELDWLREACGRVAMVRLLSGRRSEAESLEDPSAGAPPKVLMQEEARQMLWRLVDQLPPPADDLIRATYCDGLTLKEAAERLGKNKAWASRLHAKALRHLARQLQALESA